MYGRLFLFFDCQARESELERTVQELNAALVVSSRGKDENHNPGKADNSNTLLEARISALEADLEAANSQLVMEREQVSCFLTTS